MMEEYQSYIITSLDTHTFDFEELKYMRANITAMRLIDPTSFDITNGSMSRFRVFFSSFISEMCSSFSLFSFVLSLTAIHDWIQGERRNQRIFQISPEHVHLETALYHGT
jgi:glutamate receptor, ionotropic, invertebrate